jgi:leucine-zipper of insertion element IS481
MRLHGNAALTPKQRLRLARRVVDEGWSLAEAAAAAEVSERTASKSEARLGGDAAETPPFNAVATAAPRSSRLRGRVS